MSHAILAILDNLFSSPHTRPVVGTGLDYDAWQRSAQT